MKKTLNGVIFSRIDSEGIYNEMFFAEVLSMSIDLYSLPYSKTIRTARNLYSFPIRDCILIETNSCKKFYGLTGNIEIMNDVHYVPYIANPTGTLRNIRATLILECFSEKKMQEIAESSLESRVKTYSASGIVLDKEIRISKMVPRSINTISYEFVFDIEDVDLIENLSKTK